MPRHYEKTVLRSASEADVEALEKAGRRFIDRHSLMPAYRKAMETRRLRGEGDQSFADWLDVYLGGVVRLSPSGPSLSMLWHRIIRRALNHPDAVGIEDGWVFGLVELREP